jgi:hypothetical protein
MLTPWQETSLRGELEQVQKELAISLKQADKLRKDLEKELSKGLKSVSVIT